MYFSKHRHNNIIKITVYYNTHNLFATVYGIKGTKTCKKKKYYKTIIKKTKILLKQTFLYEFYINKYTKKKYFKNNSNYTYLSLFRTTLVPVYIKKHPMKLPRKLTYFSSFPLNTFSSKTS